MTPDFDHDTALERAAAGRYRGQAARRWWVGRGPNGGLLAALTLRAAGLELDRPERKPRSLTVHYLTAPDEGSLDLIADVKRSGRRTSNCLVRVEQRGQPVALALAVFATGEASRRSFKRIAFPSAPSPDHLEPVPTHRDGLPEMMQNYEYRFAVGNLPFSGAPEPTAGVWIRTAKPRRPDPVSVAAFTDAWSPMPFVELDRPAGAPTLELTVHFRDHGWYERADEDAFVLAIFRSGLLNEGFFEEQGELWSEDGVLIAQSRQLAMLIDSD